MVSTCPRCGCPNIAGSSVCAECAEPLVDQTQPSSLIRATLLTGGQTPVNEPVTPRTGHVGKLGAFTIALYANQIEDPIILEMRKEITLGRRVANSGIQPGLDLSAYGAYERGVSRVHASIRRTDAGVMVVDEGSSNGTWVNGTALPSHSSKMLTSGDQFWLARLRLEVYFLPSVQPTAQDENKTKNATPARRANFSDWIKGRSNVDAQNEVLNNAGRE